MFFRPVASAVVVVTFSISLVQAQVTLDVSKITCEQYYLAKVVHPNTVAIWLSGFHNGKRNNTVLDVERVKASAYKIRSYCRDNFQTTMMEAVEKVLGPSQVRLARSLRTLVGERQRADEKLSSKI